MILRPAFNPRRKGSGVETLDLGDLGRCTFPILTGPLASAAEGTIVDPLPRGRSVCSPGSEVLRDALAEVEHSDP